MRKQTKLVAVLSATALLAIGAAMTSFAATGWVDEDGTWVYYDADGSVVSNEWKKSGDEWYYLDEDGYMATDRIIDDYYYVDESGKMVKNQWKEVSQLLDDYDNSDPDAPDSVWYYFQNNGKAVENGWKTVNGFWYYFNGYQMQSGWQTDIEAGQTYYLGEEDDGAMKTGWMYLEPNDGEDATSPSDSEEWFYFGSNGKMYHGAVDKKINGKNYTFAEDGTMLSGWVYVKDTKKPLAHNDEDVEDATDSNAIASYKYYGDEDDGSRQAGWIKMTPPKYVNNTTSNYWYYLSSGKAKAATLKEGEAVPKDNFNKVINVNGKKYAFNNLGQMMAGDKVVAIYGAETATLSDVCAVSNIQYFGKSDDGAMKTGKQSVFIDDDEAETYTFYFATSGKYKGQAYIGEKDGYLYDAEGKMQKASSDVKYEAVENPVDGAMYLVNTAGKVMKATTSQKTKEFKDKDGNVYKVNTAGMIIE